MGTGDMKVVFYSTHCPKCMVLEKKLRQKNVIYEEVNDVELMKEKGFLNVPLLEVEGKVMEFKDANNWVNSI